MKKDKLAIVTNWFPPTQGGSFVKQQAEALSKHYEVHVFFAEFSLTKKVSVNQKNSLTVHRIHFPYLPKRTHLTMRYWINVFAKYIVTQDKKHDFKIFHAHAYLGGFVCEQVNKITGKDYFVTLHNTNLLDHSYPKIVTSYLNSSLKNAKKVICVGKQLAQSVSKKYKLTNHCVIHNMVDCSIFTESKFKNKIFTFIVIGVFDERKGLNEIVHSFLKLNQDNVKLTIAGKIKYATKETIKHIETSENINFRGYLNTKDVATAINTSNCLISFSTQESFGITVIEAMASGIPIIYSPSGGPEDFVPNFAGIQIERTESALVEGMKKMVLEYNKFESERIRDYTVEHFDNEVIVKKFKNIYDS